MAVAGPKSRDVLVKIIDDIDFSEKGLPHMAIADGRIGKIPVKVARLSFSGERAYEIYTGTSHGKAVWKAVIEAGKSYDIVPYGTEALGTLRIEKGHISGPELDGRTTMNDLGLGKMASENKQYIGSVLSKRDGLVSKNRKKMVGLISKDQKPLKAGSHVMDNEKNVGHITSTTFSPAMKKYIALALIDCDDSMINRELIAAYPLNKEQNNVLVVDPHFYDKEGDKLYA